MPKKSKKKSKKARRSPGRSAPDAGFSDLQALWESAEEWTPGAPRWTPPEDQGYEGLIINVESRLSREKDRYIIWSVQITKGEHKGKEFEDWQRIENQEGLNYLKGRFATLGIAYPDDMDKLGEPMEEACGVGIRFHTWYRGEDDEYFNMGIDEVLEGGAPVKEKETSTEEESEYSKRDIRKMSEKQLDKLCEEYGLDSNDYEEWDDVKDALIVEMGLD